MCRCQVILLAALAFVPGPALMASEFDGVYELVLRITANPCNTYLPVGTRSRPGQLVVTSGPDGQVMLGFGVDMLAIPDLHARVEGTGLVAMSSMGDTTVRLKRERDINTCSVTITTGAWKRGDKTHGFRPCATSLEGTAVRKLPSSKPFNWDHFFKKN